MREPINKDHYCCSCALSQVLSSRLCYHWHTLIIFLSKQKHKLLKPCLTWLQTSIVTKMRCTEAPLQLSFVRTVNIFLTRLFATVKFIGYMCSTVSKKGNKVDFHIITSSLCMSLLGKDLKINSSRKRLRKLRISW